MIEQSISIYSVDYIFSKIQVGSDNARYKKLLTDTYKQSNFEDFLADFIKCLKICLMHEEKSPSVEAALDFAAKFVVSFTSDLDDDESCPLLEGVFQFILENHEYQVHLVRLRICQLMNRLLDNMGHDATVLEDTYRKIAENMLLRLQDSMSSVRTQAVYALHRLQAPNDPKCEITRAFIYHMSHDPCYEVRRAIIQKIAVNKTTLVSILTRMNDVKDLVRKEAYVIISRFLIRQFTTKQRQLILECGLEDRSEVCRNYVTGVLVPNWLKYFNYNYYDFLECIHVEKMPDTGIKLLKTIFAKFDAVILESRVKQTWITNKRIPYDKLNIISVVYWRALAEFIRPTDDNDKYEHIFQQVLPDLTPFCQYIRAYFFPSESTAEALPNNSQQCAMDESVEQSSEETPSQDQSVVENGTRMEGGSNNGTKKESHAISETVLIHLLEMCKVYDLADEMGRMNVMQLCIDLLQSPAVTGDSIPVLAALLDHVIPSVATKLSVMAEIITELREPLQSDNNVYVPNLLLIEAEMKKHELAEKIEELDTEMEIANDLGDGGRVKEIKVMKKNLENELKIMDSVTPHEPGRNVKNDPATLKKCLIIVVQIMGSGKVQRMDSTLYSLLQNFIIPTLSLELEGEGASVVKNLALQALGIFCVLETELAKEHFMMFCFNIANEMLSVTALKCVFDLLHIYGLAFFNIENPFEGASANESIEYQSSRPNMILLLVSLLSSKSTEMRKTAVVGLCRLLIAGRIKSPDLISKLIVLWYNPDVENDAYVRQPLGVFFQVFAGNCSHSQDLLLKAFIPTMKEFFKLEVANPMTEVDLESVANLMVDLTRPDINSKLNKDICIHNRLAIYICEELLTQYYENANCALFFKVLNHLELNFQITTDIKILTALAARLVKSLPKEDKLSRRQAVKFETMLKVHKDKNQSVSTVCNTLSPETTLGSTAVRISSLLCPSQDGSESSGQEDDEDLSQCEAKRGTVNTLMEKMVISSSSESSEPESDETSEDSRPPVKTVKLSPEFKHPGAPPLRTPLRVPRKTPNKSSKTPARHAPSPSVGSIASSSSGASSLKTSQITTTRTSGRTPAKNKLQGDETPERKPSEHVSERVTRSGQKQINNQKKK